jgi:Rps23 Pro-64 3,4-dihydroxylase Tpa1-like proline 4-hydroxylase
MSNIFDKYIKIIENVLTYDECNKLIQLSNDHNYQIINETTRLNQRTMIDDAIFASNLLKKLDIYIPKIYNNMIFDSINPRLRFLKYTKGDYFERHKDNSYYNNGKISLITILIYLNDNYNGGFTKFFTNIDDAKGQTIYPKVGMVCFADQQIGHEVPPLIDGIKYVIRTELMYKSNVL